ncbi:MAG: FlhB protein [Bacilli bacterium]|nr:FlhB protein [Bacilli bacterium]
MDNPRKATALGYQANTDRAPRVLALGKGQTADRIIETAKANGIPIHEDAALVETLVTLDIGQEIPPELYQVVAEILVFVKRLEDRYTGV